MAISVAAVGHKMELGRALTVAAAPPANGLDELVRTRRRLRTRASKSSRKISAVLSRFDSEVPGMNSSDAGTTSCASASGYSVVIRNEPQTPLFLRDPTTPFSTTLGWIRLLHDGQMAQDYIFNDIDPRETVSGRDPAQTLGKDWIFKKR
jgi:hypothetical protein